MKLWNWLSGRTKKLDIMDIALIKWCVFAFALAIAKVWKPILSLDTSIYLILGIVLLLRPTYHFYLKK